MSGDPIGLEDLYRFVDEHQVAMAQTETLDEEWEQRGVEAGALTALAAMVVRAMVAEFFGAVRAGDALMATTELLNLFMLGAMLGHRIASEQETRRMMDA